MRRLRAAFLLLAAVAGSMLVSSGKAEASSGRAPRPWRSVAAPAVVLTLSDYVMQPLDSTDVEPPTKESEPPPPSEGNQPTHLPPGFSVQDTVTRHDSLFSVPGAAPVETIGPSSTILPVPSPPPPRPPAVRARRGIFGVHPLAILAGLIAFDIFIVTVVGK